MRSEHTLRVHDGRTRAHGTHTRAHSGRTLRAHGESGAKPCDNMQQNIARTGTHAAALCHSLHDMAQTMSRVKQRKDNTSLKRSALVRHAATQQDDYAERKKKTCKRRERSQEAKRASCNVTLKSPPPERDQQLAVDRHATDRTTVGSKADNHRAIPIVPFPGQQQERDAPGVPRAHACVRGQLANRPPCCVTPQGSPDLTFIRPLRRPQTVRQAW